MNNDIINILLVEDNPGDVRLIQENLKDTDNFNFKLDHVFRLSEAKERINKQKFDIILLDLSLPDSSGIDTFNNIHKYSSDLPIIILSGNITTQYNNR